MARHHDSHAWRKLRDARKALGRATLEPCAMCGGAIRWDLPGTHRLGPSVDHPNSIALGGELLPPISDLRMVHRKCNNAQGARISNYLQRKNAAGGGGGRPRKKPQDIQNGPHPPGNAPAVSYERDTTPRPLRFDPLSSGIQGQPENVSGYTMHSNGSPGMPENVNGYTNWGEVPWLADLFPLPESAQFPTEMSLPHPRAVGSYGQAAEEWLRTYVQEQGRPLVLRWWQRLALRRQLEHDADGVLVWTQVVESTPRRSGKSVRLRAVALWRIHHAPMIGETQLVLLTGKDVPIVREIIRKAWPWAQANGHDVRKANGQEEIESPDGSRWIVRSKDSVYGYDVGLGLVDECHGVDAGVVDDGLEPALLERRWPQLVMTSTAHRKATSLMRHRLAAAKAQKDDPVDVLLLLWCAPRNADVTDRNAWRLASPHWTPERERMIAGVLERVQAGTADPDPDEPDPVEALRAQYLNIWPEAQRRSSDWLPVALVEPCGTSSGPLAAGRVGAVESSVDGVQWSAAVSDGEHARVAVGFPRLPLALAWLDAEGAQELVAHAAVLARLDADYALPTHAVTVGEDCAATSTLADAIQHGSIAWASPGGGLLGQFGNVVTMPTPGGPRIAPRLSRGPVEAVQALARAHWRAVHEAPEAGAVF